MNIFHTAVTAGVAMLGLSTAWAAPETFTIDNNHTYPMFEASHFGISVQRGRFDKTIGKIVLDRDAKTGRIDVSIDAASINMGFEEWNKKLRGEDFFHVEKFPVITYRSNELIFEGDRPVAAEGEFTLLGITKPLRLTVLNFACTQVPVLNKVVCGAEVAGAIKRSEFGMKMGVPFVADDVRLLAPIEAQKE